MNQTGCWKLALCLAAGAIVTGCQSSAQSPPAVSQADIAAGTVPTNDEEAVLAELQGQHRHHHGGFVGFVMMAIETIDVTPEQQAAIDGIKADFRAKTQPLRDANDRVIKALADGIGRGSIDAPMVDAAIAGLTSVSAQTHAATIDALNRLHDVLRAEQRLAIADKLEAHWTVWKETNGGEVTDDLRTDGHIGRIAAEIGLTSDQIDKVRANIAATTTATHSAFDPAEVEAHMKALAAAFASETFDGNTMSMSAPSTSRLATWGASRMARFYEALSPVLTPDQRGKVADKLRQHTSKL